MRFPISVIVLVLLFGVHALCWERLNKTVVWSVHGSGGSAGVDAYGDQLGFKIVTANTRGVSTEHLDLCVLCRGNYTLQCYHHDGTFGFENGYSTVPDYSWVSTTCTDWSNECGCGRKYNPYNLVAGYAGTDSYEDVAIVASTSLWGADYQSGQKDRPDAYTFVIEGSATGLTNYASHCCVRSPVVEVVDDRGAYCGLAFGNVHSNTGNEIITSIVKWPNRNGAGSSTTDISPSSISGTDLSALTTMAGYYKAPVEPNFMGTAYNLFGYALETSSTFSGTGATYDDVFASAPLAFEDYDIFGQGVVLGFHAGASGWTPTLPFIGIKGEQMGEEFGYVLKCGDINGDGLDDLIIGAPAYRLYDTADVGRIVIILGSTSYATATEPPSSILDSANLASSEGQSLINPSLSGLQYSRFGHSIAIMPDLDSDGFNELFVGSPGHDGYRGRVLMFAGKSYGVDPEPVWIRDDPTVGLKSMFGSSLAITRANNDSYSDLFVGGYGEYGDPGAVYLFLANPNAYMNVTYRDVTSTNKTSGSRAEYYFNVQSNGPEFVNNITVLFTFPGMFSLNKTVTSNLLCEPIPSSFPPDVIYTWEYTCYIENFGASDEAEITFTIDTLCALPSNIYTFDYKMTTDLIQLAGNPEGSLLPSWQNLASFYLKKVNQSASSMFAGEYISFEVEYEQQGPSCAVNPQIVVHYPYLAEKGLIHTSVLEFSVGSCLLESMGGIEERLLCTPNRVLEPGTNVSFSIMTQVDPSFAGDTALFSMELVTLSETVTNRTLYSQNLTAAVSSSGDMEFGNFTVLPSDSVDAGDLSSYYLPIFVAGPSSAMDVNILYDFPVNGSYDSLHITSGTSQSKLVPTVSCTECFNTYCSKIPNLLNTTREYVNCTFPALPPTISTGYDIVLSAKLDSIYSEQTATIDLQGNTSTTQITPKSPFPYWFRTVSYGVSQHLDLSIYLYARCNPLCTPAAYVIYSMDIANNGPSAGYQPKLYFTYPDEVSLYRMPTEFPGFTCTHDASEKLVECNYNNYVRAGLHLPLVEVIVYVPKTVDWQNTTLESASNVTSGGFAIETNPANNVWLNSLTLYEREADLRLERIAFLVPLNETFEEKKDFTWDGNDYGTIQYPASNVGSFLYNRDYFWNETMMEVSILVSNTGMSTGGTADMYIAVTDRFALFDTDKNVMSVPTSTNSAGSQLNGLPPPYITVDGGSLPSEMEPFCGDECSFFNRTDVTLIHTSFTEMDISYIEIPIGKFYHYQVVNSTVFGLKFCAFIVNTEVKDPDPFNNILCRTSAPLIYRPLPIPPRIITSSSDTTKPAGEVAAETSGWVLLAIILALLIFLLMCCILYCFVCLLGGIAHYQRRRMKRAGRKRQTSYKSAIASALEGNDDDDDDDSGSGSDDDLDDDDDDDDDEDDNFYDDDEDDDDEDDDDDNDADADDDDDF